MCWRNTNMHTHTYTHFYGGQQKYGVAVVNRFLFRSLLLMSAFRIFRIVAVSIVAAAADAQSAIFPFPFFFSSFFLYVTSHFISYLSDIRSFVVVVLNVLSQSCLLYVVLACKGSHKYCSWVDRNFSSSSANNNEN